MLIVDASVAVKWLLQEAGTPRAEALLTGEDTLWAPTLVLSEVANALWKAAKHGFPPEKLRAGMIDIANSFSHLVPIETLVGQALGLAIRHDHPVYDCLYVALAIRESAPLVTADRRLAERFSALADTRLL